MDWSTAIEVWLVAQRAAGRPPTTVKLRAYQLERVGAAMLALGLGPWDVDGGELVAWVGAQGWAPETLRSFRSALRGFYRWGHGAGHVEVDPALALPSVTPARPNPRPTPEDEYRLALAKSDDRVRLMVRLAAELGMRRGEVARAHRGDLERDLTGWSLRVHGKGGKVRMVPVTDSLAAAIRRRGAGYLFPGNDGGHLSAPWVGRLVSRALPAAWAMHSLRHRFGTVAFSVDRDLLTVQALMGHASPVTTQRYVLVPDAALRRTVAAVAAV